MTYEDAPQETAPAKKSPSSPSDLKSRKFGARIYFLAFLLHGGLAFALAFRLWVALSADDWPKTRLWAVGKSTHTIQLPPLSNDRGYIPARKSEHTIYRYEYRVQGQTYSLRSGTPLGTRDARYHPRLPSYAVVRVPKAGEGFVAFVFLLVFLALAGLSLAKARREWPV